MNVILVPTDFSSVSKNAALYAVQLADSFAAAKIILYNTYTAPVVIEPYMQSVPMLELDLLKDASENALEKFKLELEAVGQSNIAIACVSEYGELSATIDELAARLGAGLIVMGISGGNKFDEIMIGSHATSVVKHTKIPVIIVPSEARYTPVKKVVFACDYKKIVDTTPVQQASSFVTKTNAELLVLKVVTDTAAHTEEDEKTELLLSELFIANRPTFFAVANEDFAEGVNDFVQEHSADIVICIPKKHGLFEGWFTRSHTKQLAFHAHVPLMCIHVNDL